MQEKNNKKSFWPYGITISILLIAAACIYNVKIALEYPVEYDTYFLSSKQDLDDNINHLLASQKAFNEKYKVEVVYDKFKAKNNEIKIKIINKNTKQAIPNANIDLLITRPDVSAFDIKPKFIGLRDGYYTFKSFDVNKVGRWQILFNATIGQLKSFVKLETYAVLE